MPAWITSLLRELVCVPIAPSASRTTTSRPSIARRRAIASPTTPAPIPMQSTRSTSAPCLDRGGEGAAALSQESPIELKSPRSKRGDLRIVGMHWVDQKIAFRGQDDRWHEKGGAPC